MKRIIQAIKGQFITKDHINAVKSSVISDGLLVLDIAFYRDRIFNLLTFCLIPTGLIALVPGVFIAIKKGTTLGYLVAAGDLFIAGALVCVIVSKRLKVKVKKVVIIASLYSLSIFLMIFLGSFGPGVIYLSLITIIMSLIFENRTARLSIWINLTICIFLGAIIEFDLFHSQLKLQYNLEDWLAYASNLMVFSVITFLLISNLIQSLERKISKLSVSEARQHGLLASQTNYVIRTDMDGKYTYANEKFVRDFGWVYDNKNILGYNAITSVLPYHHQRLKETVYECLKDPSKVFQVSLDKPKAKGGVLTTLWEFICVKDDFSEAVEIQCVGIDISERIRVEQELELSLEDLYKHNKELQTYAYVISHTLRAPIANIVGLVSLIEIDRADEKVMSEYIADLKESATSLDEVVKDLSRGVSIGGLAVESFLEEVNLQEIFSSIRAELTTLVGLSDAKLTLPNEPFMLRSYKPYLHIIFYNLIYNALKFRSERKPSVIVTITTHAQFVVITVADNGIGIDVEKQYDNLFKPYKRLNITVPGKGLGLFFVKRHIDALRGIILVESELGIGSTFKVFLPTHEV